jgi:hypothetical protein
MYHVEYETRIIRPYRETVYYATFEEAEATVRRMFGRVSCRALEKVDGEVVFAEYRILPTQKKVA